MAKPLVKNAQTHMWLIKYQYEPHLQELFASADKI